MYGLWSDLSSFSDADVHPFRCFAIAIIHMYDHPYRGKEIRVGNTTDAIFNHESGISRFLLRTNGTGQHDREERNFMS